VATILVYKLQNYTNQRRTIASIEPRPEALASRTQDGVSHMRPYCIYLQNSWHRWCGWQRLESLQTNNQRQSALDTCAELWSPLADRRESRLGSIAGVGL